ncbi:MAG: hypothetical protein AB8C46_10760 [Burkholderiaceae bacterium]
MAHPLKQIASTIAAAAMIFGSCQVVMAATDKSNIPNPPMLSKDNPAPKAQTRTAPTEAAKNAVSASLYWYDGPHKRMLSVDPNRLADFGNSDQGSAAQPKMIDQAAALTGKDQSASAMGNADATTREGVSPVFQDASSGQDAGALPGGVMVRTLRPLDAASANAMARAFGSSTVRPIGSPMSQDGLHDFWLFETPAGLPALELANRLHESGQVDSAAPNWWKTRQLK